MSKTVITLSPQLRPQAQCFCLFFLFFMAHIGHMRCFHLLFIIYEAAFIVYHQQDAFEGPIKDGYWPVLLHFTCSTTRFPENQNNLHFFIMLFLFVILMPAKLMTRNLQVSFTKFALNRSIFFSGQVLLLRLCIFNAIDRYKVTDDVRPHNKPCMDISEIN